ncbi:RNA polymerase sigma factor [Mycobacterium sp. NPDC051804]|uniref:RNA polymerase sigma factor n=1 Tax=Mycobacterium sp. NPDC051804 TaxID=3364295 RepID=UPI00379C166D
MASTTTPPVKGLSDAELATAAATGDREALEAIYHRYAGRLHNYCVGLVRDHHTAADCVQDVFCIAASDIHKLREPEKLRPWLYSIARHAALRTLHEQRREPAFDEVPDTVALGPGPFTLTARNELAQLVVAAARGLSERDRAVLELAYRQGLAGPELARALGVSHDCAKKLLQRLRQTFERSLGALMVARHAAQHGCSQLAEALSGWDDQFTVLTRKRVARHIESCSTCDDYRRSLVSSVATLGSGVIKT